MVVWGLILKIKSFYDLEYENNVHLHSHRYCIVDYEGNPFFDRAYLLFRKCNFIDGTRYLLNPYETIADEKDDGTIHD